MECLEKWSPVPDRHLGHGHQTAEMGHLAQLIEPLWCSWPIKWLHKKEIMGKLAEVLHLGLNCACSCLCGKGWLRVCCSKMLPPRSVWEKQVPHLSFWWWCDPMGHPKGIFSYRIAGVRSHPRVQYYVTFSLPMSCRKNLPQVVMHSVKWNLLSLLCRWRSELGFVPSAPRFSPAQEEQPHSSEALQTASELCWELDSHNVWWSRNQCCAGGVTNREHFISAYVIFIVAVINLPRFLSRVLE